MNFITIMTDGLRGDFANNPVYTPNLHRFFREYNGYKFVNAYSTSNWTGAAKMSFHTGLLPSKNGVWDITYARHTKMIETWLGGGSFKATNCTKDEFLLTKMKKAGYTTKYIGDKRIWRMLQNSVGYLYDTNSYYDRNYMQLKTWKQEEFKEPFFVFSYDADGGHDPWGVFIRDDTEVWKTEMVDKLNGDHPTVFRTSYVMKHQKDFPTFRLYKLYGDQVKQYDRKLKDFFEWFVKSGLYKNTAIFFLADHGESLYEHSNIVGHAKSLYEEEIHIPLFVYYPSAKNSGLKEISDPISIVDIMPTILDVETMADGVNLFKRKKDRLLFFEFTRYKKEKDINLEWKVLPSPNDFIRGVRFGDYKLIYTRDLTGKVTVKLYNLPIGISESNKAKIKNPELKKFLLDKVIETFNMDIENLQHVGRLEEVVKMEIDYLDKRKKNRK